MAVCRGYASLSSFMVAYSGLLSPIFHRVLWLLSSPMVPIESHSSYRVPWLLSSPMESYDFLCLSISDEGRKSPFTRPSHFRTPFPMLKAVPRFVIPFYPGNLTERIVHPGQHGVPFRYPILTRLNNVSIILIILLIPVYRIILLFSNS